MTPLAFDWNGESMTPIRAHRRRADGIYTIGCIYVLEPVEARNMAQHRGYFARIREAWLSLPEKLAEEYPSPEALRHRALIKSGYATLTELVAANSVQAARTAAAFTEDDPYALVEISDRAVRIWRAESQKVRRGNNGGMEPERFKASIDAVENWISDLIGVRTEELRRVA